MEEQDGRRRSQQEKISILYWSVRTRNSSPPSSSRSFRTQFHWSYIAGQCVNSEQLASSTFIILDVQSVYTPSQIQDWKRDDKILAGKDRRYSLQPWIPWIRITKDPQELDLTKPRLALYKQKWKRHQDTVYWVDIQLAQRKGLEFYQSRSIAIIFYDTLPAYCISKVVGDEIWRNHVPEGICVTSTTTENFLQR